MNNKLKLSDLLTKNKLRSKTKKQTKTQEETPSDTENFIKVVDDKIVLGNLDNFKASKECYYDTKINDDDVLETSRTFSRRLKNTRWNENTTNIFYEALQVCGTDFSLMCEIFVGRDRRQLKNKYKIELKKNTKRMDDNLNLKAQYKKGEVQCLKEKYLFLTKKT